MGWKTTRNGTNVHMIMTRSVQTIPEQIAEQLRKDILAGMFEEDTPLREQELSERFGVSRGPVRAALQQLVKEGLVDAVPNVGVRVAPRPNDDVHSIIIRMRRIIEEFTLSMIFDNLNDEVIDYLEEILNNLRIACVREDREALQDHDRSFHSALVELYGDKRLFHIWHSMFTSMMFRYGRHTNLIESYQEHQAILDAIKQKNKKKALELLKNNIQ